jgi:Reverse transcriptase (RNA-dependent DNA polymerase)
MNVRTLVKNEPNNSTTNSCLHSLFFSSTEMAQTCFTNRCFARSICLQGYWQHELCSYKFINYPTSRLEYNDYIRCLLVDFSKAFDTVSHAIVIPKLNMLDMPGSIKNWIISFLTGRLQKVKVNGFLSNSQCINRSIVQGSGIGPFLYILMESDLHPLSQINEILKYADDTNLLVTQHTDISMSVEYQNVMNWASLKIN